MKLLQWKSGTIYSYKIRFSLPKCEKRKIAQKLNQLRCFVFWEHLWLSYLERTWATRRYYTLHFSATIILYYSQSSKRAYMAFELHLSPTAEGKFDDRITHYRFCIFSCVKGTIKHVSSFEIVVFKKETYIVSWLY